MSTLLNDRGHKRANVVGVGMIGASVGAALRRAGWHVSGSDESPQRCEVAQASGAIDVTAVDPEATISFIATPGASVPEIAASLLANGGWVTDVASVKTPVVASVRHANFVGGHPMAGSEKSGPENAIASLFEGATWVLTPSETTSSEALSSVKEVVEQLGALTVTISAVGHDRAVASVSHVPHLVSSALMAMATTTDSNEPSRLRLAAGGFRDMTRIAAGSPDMWTDIAVANRVAVTSELDQLIEELTHMRAMISGSDRDSLRRVLEVAAVARRSLPERAGRPTDLAVLRIVVPDEPGSLGQILGVFGRLEINVEDFEITHDESNRRGYLEVTVAAPNAATATGELVAAGFVVGSEEL